MFRSQVNQTYHNCILWVAFLSHFAAQSHATHVLGLRTMRSSKPSSTICCAVMSPGTHFRDGLWVQFKSPKYTSCFTYNMMIQSSTDFACAWRLPSSVYFVCLIWVCIVWSKEWKIVKNFCAGHRLHFVRTRGWGWDGRLGGDCVCVGGGGGVGGGGVGRLPCYQGRLALMLLFVVHVYSLPWSFNIYEKSFHDVHIHNIPPRYCGAQLQCYLKS